MKTTYYLIVSNDVGPNDHDSSGNIKGDTETGVITTMPGRKNMSKEICTDGWLGTTNDNSLTAHGEYETIDEARAAAHKLGLTQPLEQNDDDYPVNPGELEYWISEEAARDQWDAGEWFGSWSDGDLSTEYGVSATSDDSDILLATNNADAEAVAENAEVHGLDAFFTELRNKLREETWTNSELSERITLCQTLKVSRFAARRDEWPNS